MQNIIAIFDIGKTNKKILIFDEKFAVLSQKEEKFPTITDKDNFDCDDIDLIIRWIKDELVVLLENQEYNIIAVNFSTYGASLMFLDDKGKRLTPVYNYLKEISVKISETLFKQYKGKDEFCRKTASPALGFMLNSGIQMLWLQKERAEIMSKVKSILHFPQYLSYELTKQIVSEPTSIGCHTFLWDFDKMTYHQWTYDKKITLPEPVNNDVMFPSEINGKIISVGIGIHDSSAALVPYLKTSKEKFILVSTGTWCVNMNPFNDEPLTNYQLQQDCLCFLSPDKKQVKSSRFFMGHFHEVWVEKFAKHYQIDIKHFKTFDYNEMYIKRAIEEYGKKNVFFPNGKESFEEGLNSVDLNSFSNYERAYTKFMIDLTDLCVESINLVISKNDDSDALYIAGGFARNKLFMHRLTNKFKNKKVYTSEIDNASALGAALILSEKLEGFNASEFKLGQKEWL